jgi:ADP-heptose:LPS heptosyltransferase
MHEFKNILISITAHVGDFIWATSAFAILKKTYPDIKITVLVPNTVKELIANNPVIDDVIYTSYSNIDNKPKINKLLWTLKIIPKMFLTNFDAILIFDSSRASILLSKLTRIPRIIGGDLFYAGYDKPDPTAKYYTDKITMPKDQDNMHASVRFQTIIKSFFNIYNNAMPVLPNSTKHTHKAISIIKEHCNINIALCVIGSKTSTNIWSVENYKKVMSYINNYYSTSKVSFYLIGTKENFDYSQAAIINDNVYNICGKTSLLELKEFLNKMHLLISCDTGVIHVAATTKTNILSLHGPCPFVSTGPMSHKAVSIYKKISCSPCVYKRDIEHFKCLSYPNPECFKQITAEEVAETAVKILNQLF